MSVSVESRGRGRKVDANLNLVPFIDLLSVCIIFLIATAVWIELSSIRVDQALSDPGPLFRSETLPPVLTVHVRADGVWVGRKVEDGHQFIAVGGRYDWSSVERVLTAERQRYPTERQVTLVTDDGVSYEHMIAALDLTRKHGYDQSLLGGGPPLRSLEGP